MNPVLIEEVANQVAQITVDIKSIQREVEALAHSTASKLANSPRLKHGRACLGQAAEKCKQAIILLEEFNEFCERELNNYEPKESSGIEKIPTKQGWSKE